MASDIVLMVVIVVAVGAMATVVVLRAVLANKYCMFFFYLCIFR